MVRISSSAASAPATMSTPLVIKPHLPVRRLAPDQKYAKLPRLSKAAKARIVKRGYDRILADTGSEELAKEYQQTIKSVLAESDSW